MKTENILKRKYSINWRSSKYYLYDFENLSEKDTEEIKEYFQYDYDKYKRDYRFMVVDANSESFNFYYYKQPSELYNDFTSFSMFDKSDRSSFKYWFAHWCGFQLTALNLGIWKPKYLLHDIEKPWLKLLWKGNYKKVQIWHRNHNAHHLEYGFKNGWDKIDWEALMIDWQCCGLSKREAQLDARETMEYEVKMDKWKPYESIIRKYLEPILLNNNL